jgi:hypothetical protein
MPILAVVVAASAALAAPAQFKPDVFPKELFVKESSPVLITVSAPSGATQLTLLEVDETGKKLRYIGVMTDDGVMGDKIRGDGVYTRKISVTEKRAKKFYYSVIEETAAGGVPEQVDPALINSIEIVGRPSMVEVLAIIWDKIKGHAPKL